MTEEEINRLVSLVNQRMQGTYAAALGSNTRAYDISDRLGRGYAHALRSALEDMGQAEARDGS